MPEQPDQEDRIRQLTQEAEKSTAAAMEQLVQSNGFGELLARSTENVMGLTKIGFDTFDLIVRNLRLAGRRDVVRLGQQLSRTEDKLEQVLQEVEQLRDEAESARAEAERAGKRQARSSDGSRSRSRSGRSSSSNGSAGRSKTSSSRSR